MSGWTVWATYVEPHELGLLRWELEARRGRLAGDVVAITDRAGRLVDLHAGPLCGARHERALTHCVAERLRELIATRCCMQQLDAIECRRPEMRHAA